MILILEDAAKQWRHDLMEMATEALLEKVEQDKGYQDLQFLLKKQNWMEKLKEVSLCLEKRGEIQQFQL